jgi:hypothetical protein
MAFFTGSPERDFAGRDDLAEEIAAHGRDLRWSTLGETGSKVWVLYPVGSRSACQVFLGPLSGYVLSCLPAPLPHRTIAFMPARKALLSTEAPVRGERPC